MSANASIAREMSVRGHFTTMQVRSGAVRGLDLHLQRLVSATIELFEIATDEAYYLDAIRGAIADAAAADCTLRISASRTPDETTGAEGRQSAEIDVSVSLTGPASFPCPPARIRSVAYQRAQPHLKHDGILASRKFLQQAVDSGFDDVLFVDIGTRVLEGSFWNIGFWRRGTMTWPTGPALRGTCEALMQAGFEELGVGQESRSVELHELRSFDAAVMTNARGFRLLSCVDEVVFEEDAALRDLLLRALDTQPWQSI